jgi:hypothetical protein
MNSIYIHISDGGQNENLGIYALFRRHVKDIIVADGGQDTNYTLDDFCVLAKQLQDGEHELYIDVGKKEFNLAAGLQPCRTGKNPYGIQDALPEPILRGRICKKGGCSDQDAESRLYIIKAALNKKAKPLRGIALQDAIDLATSRTASLHYEDCFWLPAAADPGYPCEVVTYLAKPSTKKFPQDTTVAVTLNSNAYIFGAYKELGRYYATHLSLNADSEGTPLKVDDSWTAEDVLP